MSDPIWLGGSGQLPRGSVFITVYSSGKIGISSALANMFKLVKGSYIQVGYDDNDTMYIKESPDRIGVPVQFYGTSACFFSKALVIGLDLKRGDRFLFLPSEHDKSLMIGRRMFNERYGDTTRHGMEASDGGEC